MKRLVNVFEYPGFSSATVDQIGVVLLHSVWQIALLSLVFAVVCRVLKKARSDASGSIYAAGMIVLLLCAALPVVTFLALEPEHRQQAQAMKIDDQTRRELAVEMVKGSSESRFLLLEVEEDSSSGKSDANIAVVDPTAIGRRPRDASVSAILWSIADWVPERSLGWLTLGWIVGVLLLTLRTCGGLLQVVRLRLTCDFRLPRQLQRVVSRATESFPVTMPVRYAMSRCVDVPSVIGSLRPIVLLPAAALTGLSAKQIELIIIHELAHVRRNDFLLNLLQSLVESLLFFHPCIWWISRVVRQERENCCDNQAVRFGDASNYASALVQLEKNRLVPDFAMTATGSNLLHRIRRLAGQQVASDTSRSRSATWLSGVVCAMVLCSVAALPHVNVASAQEDDGSDYKSVKVAKDFAKTKMGKVLDQEMKKLKQVGFSGCVLVAHKGKIILVRSEGKLDGRKAIAPNTLFEIASVTKSFTATAAMILAERGKLDLDASIADYLPSVPEESKRITVADLLLHESGIPGDSYGDTQKDLRTAVKTMLAGGPRVAPGTKHEYWNQGYILLSEIITKAAGEPYTNFLRREIFEPCGMTGTCFTGDDQPKGFVASIGTGKMEQPRSCLDHPYGKMELVYQGTGGIVTNVTDLWKFHKALLGNELLNDESKSILFEVGVSNYYASGWYVGKATNDEIKQYHGGGVRGFVCQFARFPETDSCIVVLCNNKQSPAATVANVIEGILLPPKLPGEILDAEKQKKIVGQYKDDRDRIMVVIASGEKDIPTKYMIYWEPKNPSAPVSRGSVLKNKDDEFVFYQPGDTSTVSVTYSKDRSKVESVTLPDIDLTFERIDSDAPKKR